MTPSARLRVLKAPASNALSARMSADAFRATIAGDAATGRRTKDGRRSRDIRALPLQTQVPLSPLPFSAELPFLPPSVNGLFSSVVDATTGRPKRVLTSQARQARRAIESCIHGRLSPGEIYELHLRIELPALTRAGHLRKVDLSNRVKFLEDCIAARLGIDDRQFFRIVLDKVHADQERTLIKILPFQANRIAA